MDAKTVLIIGLVVVAGWLVLSDSPDNGHDSGRYDAASVAAGEEAVRIFRDRLSRALEEQATAAAAGRFGSSSDYAAFMEPLGDQAFREAMGPMDQRLQETVGRGEWDAVEAAEVSRGLAKGVGR